MKRIMMLAALAVVLAGCSTAIHLRNMAGMTVTCGPYGNAGLQAYSVAQRESQCVSDFQRQGYERASD